MHHIGLSALHASAHMIHARAYVVASLAIAVATSGLALWLATGRGGRPPLILSAIAFGIAVSGMHYTAMAGISLFPHAATPPEAPALSTDLLAFIVAIVAFGVSGIFLLILVPEHARSGLDAVPERPAMSTATGPAKMAAAAAVDEHGESPDVGRGDAQLGDAGGSPRRFARHLPVERDGATHFVPVEDVVAIRANAHYTYIFNGNDNVFCPLAIGEIESRLDNSRFVRVHRSHIVNLDRVVGYKRSGDNELVEMDSASNYAVPVSRSRIGWLKSRMAAVTGTES
jgi:DNA-binding LytR/AlgR family response regulator